MPSSEGEARPRAAGVQLLCAAVGLALLFAAWSMNGGWAERHFLPAWAYPWETQLKVLLGLRIVVAATGLAILLLLRPWAARAVVAGRGRQALTSAATAAAAVALAFVAVEIILHTRTWQSAQERWDKQEPLRARNAEYGWTFVPNHAGKVALHGRMIHYDTGPHGYRVAAAGEAPDFARPAIVFAGESITLGYGLEWPETVPAQVQALTGVQAVNMAVNAHATDQTLLRLRRELPRFAHPAAVVIPFVPCLFDRNLDTDRPHLDAELGWHAGDRPSFRIVELARRAARYRTERAIAEGTRMTRRALKAMIAMAQARGARALIVVPQFLPESDREAQVRRAVLDTGGIPYLLVPIPAEWRFPVDRHPTPAGARLLAERIAAALASAR
jgi:lysophospholipase L1-like esterase